MTLTTLVLGASAAAREAALAAHVQHLPAGQSCHFILEGLAGASDVLANALAARTAPVEVVRIAPACPCCTGNLVMRVTLNRLLRRAPDALFIALASTEHLPQVRQFLSEPPYAGLLTLQADLDLSQVASTTP